MPGKVPQQSSNAPKSGASASLANKITSNGRVKTAPPSPNSTASSNNSEATDSQAQIQDTDNLDQASTSSSQETQSKQFKEYNQALENYQNEDKGLAFMKEDNFKNSLDENGEKISISELNAFMASSDSLASRINSVTGRGSAGYVSQIENRNGSRASGRSRLPGDDGGPRTGDNVPDFLPRFALTRSQLYLGYDPKTGKPNGSSQSSGSYTSRINRESNSSSSAVNNALNGNPNTTVNFEAYSSAYLKANAPELSRQFENDPSFRAKYLQNVEKLYNGIDVRTLGQAPVEEKRSRLVGQAGLSTSRERQQVANSFMTLLAKNDNQIDKIAKSGLTVFLADSIVSEGENVAGYFSTDNHMVLSRNPGFASFNATAVHELTHVIDFSDGSLDGHINGLSPNWSSLREDASRKIQATGGNLSGLESGFVNYSQTNDMEFLAVMSQLYQSDTKDLQKNFSQIFSALDRMFRVA
jgi:hypothetical protein